MNDAVWMHCLNNIMKLLITVFCLLLVSLNSTDCKKDPIITSELIASRIQPPEGWSIVSPSRPDMSMHKIARDSGYATIVVNKEVDLLMEKYDYTDYETAVEILDRYSKKALKKRFAKVANRSARAVFEIDSIYVGKVGDIPALVVVHDFKMNENKVLGRIRYYYVIGDKGWISIGCGFKKEEELLYVEEFEEILQTQ